MISKSKAVELLEAQLGRNGRRVMLRETRSGTYSDGTEYMRFQAVVVKEDRAYTDDRNGDGVRVYVWNVVTYTTTVHQRPDDDLDTGAGFQGWVVGTFLDETEAVEIATAILAAAWAKG